MLFERGKKLGFGAKKFDRCFSNAWKEDASKRYRMEQIEIKKQMTEN